MKTTFEPIAPSTLTVARRILCGAFLAVGIANHVHAQGDIPSGTIVGSGSGPYTYNLTFSDAAGATSSIGSVWYAWVPGVFYLPSTPTNAFAPSGWTATIDANSVKYVANSPASYIAAGQTLSGFGYTATFSPDTLRSTSNSGRSDAYTAGLFSDGGIIFTVQAVPEPTTPLLLLSGLLLWSGGRRMFRARRADGGI